MHFSTLITLLAVGTTSVSAGRRHRVTRQANADINNDLIAAMVTADMEEPNPAGFPADFGLTPGPVLCSGNRVGDKPGEKNIACDCPPAPTNATFRAAVKVALNLGFFPDQRNAVPPVLEADFARVTMNIRQWNDLSFTDPAAIALRNGAMVVAFQSLSGKRGVGCPGISAPVFSATG